MKNGTKVLLLKDIYEEGVMTNCAGDIGQVTDERILDSARFGKNCVGVEFDDDIRGEYAIKLEDLVEWTGTCEERDVLYPDRKKKIEAAV